MTHFDTDIAIAGAGLTGRLMALALAHEGRFSVALIDPSPTGGGTIGGAPDGRTTAIAFASARLFQRLGVWAALADGAAPIHDILVTNGAPADRFRKGGLSGGALHFPSSLLPDTSAADGPTDQPLGHIVENSAMNEAFEVAVQAHPKITCHYGTKVIRTTEDPGAVALSLSDGRTLTAKTLVACDGKNSPIRRRLGFKSLDWPYDQKAMIFNVGHEIPHNGVAQEVFYPAGPFAILPMTENRCSIVWTEAARTADAFMALSEPAFLEAATQRIGTHLGALTLASDRACFGLTFHHVLNPVMGRVVLAGDAAHTIHPIAGQGFNLGIKDVAALADVLSQADAAGLDIGHGAVLDRYARWRRFDTASLTVGTDMMNRLFSNDLAPIRWARSLGLGVVQKIDPARRFFMRHAGADVGDLPTLMQPFAR